MSYFFQKMFNNIQDRKLSTHPVPTLVGLILTIICNLAGGEILVKYKSIFCIMSM